MLSGLEVRQSRQNEANVALSARHIPNRRAADSHQQSGTRLIPIFPSRKIFGDDPNSQLDAGRTGNSIVSKSSDSALTIYVDNVQHRPDPSGRFDNYDGKVNAEDFAILAANYGGSGTVLSTREISTATAKIDSSDFNILASNFTTDRPRIQRRLWGRSCLNRVVPVASVLAVRYCVCECVEKRNNGRRAVKNG